MMAPGVRILQIMPADGWRWRYSDWPDGESAPLTGFALVELDWNDGGGTEGDGKETRVVGFDLVESEGLHGLVDNVFQPERLVGVAQYLPPEDRP